MVTTDKTILMPNASRIEDIFVGFGKAQAKTLTVMQSDLYQKYSHRRGRDRMEISNFIWISSTDLSTKVYFDSLTEEAMRLLTKSLIVVDNDSIYFEIIEQANHLSLVIARHNQIIGSRWLAYVESDSIRCLE